MLVVRVGLHAGEDTYLCMKVSVLPKPNSTRKRKKIVGKFRGVKIKILITSQPNEKVTF